MSNNIKISLIIPVYNSAKYLEDCICSILNQSFSDYELILIDDGSQDNSLDICKRFEQQDQRITVIHKENKGVSVVRNLGIEKAAGEYIRLMDADDILPENSLQELIQPFELHEDIDLVLGEFETNDKTLYTGDNLNGVKTKEELVCHFLNYIRSFYYGVIWNKLYKTSLIKENNIQFEENLQWSEDLFFNLNYFSVCKKVFYVNSSVYYYFRRANSLSNISGHYSEDDSFEIEMRRFCAVRKFILTADTTENYENETYNFLFNKVNERLNGILNKKDLSEKEKFECFCHVLKNEELNRYIQEYPYHNRYYLNNYLVKMIRKKKYNSLFHFYKMKYFMKKSDIIRNYAKKQDRILPKYPL